MTKPKLDQPADAQPERIKLAHPWRDHEVGETVEVTTAEAFELRRAGYAAKD